MTGKKFLAVYTPHVVAIVFIVAFFNPDGPYVPSGAYNMLTYFLGIATAFVILTFGLGAVIWSIGYAFYTEKPSYLKTVIGLTSAFVILAIVTAIGMAVFPEPALVVRLI
jgi:hypothetical protein